MDDVKVTDAVVKPAPIPPKEIKIVANRPKPDELLSPAFLYEKVVPKLVSLESIKEKFTETEKQYHLLDVVVKTAKCTGCELNKKGKGLLDAFIAEMKSCSTEEQIAVTSILGKRVVTAVNQNWVNLATNEVTPFEFRMAMVISPEQKNGLIPLVPTAQSPQVADTKISQGLTLLPSIKKRKILFQNFQGPGDIVMLSAAIRDMFMKYKSEGQEIPFVVDVKTSSMSIWEGNPYVECAKGTPLDEKDPDVEVFKLGYPLIHQSNQGPYHFTEAFTEEIEDKLNIRIKKRICKGDIHIRPEEEVWGWTERSTWFKDYGIDPNAEYWIIDAGHKQDFTAKFWGKSKYQSIVEHYKGKIQFVQIGHTAHIHPILDGAINLVGKTDDRQLIRLIWASSGVLTPVSFPMVLSAAIPVKKGTCKGRLERPCVVVAGGREPSGWQAYTNHQFVHTCGSLPCCDRGGCWASRTKPIGDNDEKDTKNMCHNVTIDDYGDEVPFCMHMISVDDVIRRMDMYYQFYDEDRKKYTYNKK